MHDSVFYIQVGERGGLTGPPYGTAATIPKIIRNGILARGCLGISGHKIVYFHLPCSMKGG